MLGSILGPIDASIVNTILPAITRSFSSSLSAAEWVPMAYLLTIGSLALFFGRAGDIWGYRTVFVSGIAGFCATSALCGLAPAMGALIFFRALQGLAAATLMSVPLAILTGVFPPHERGKALGLYAISISVGLALGPSLGGLLASTLGWRAAFFINLPVGAAAAILAWRRLPHLQGRGGKMDYGGALFAFAGLCSFLLFVTRVQQEGLSALAGATLILSLCCAAAFLRAERGSNEPMLDLRLFSALPLSFGALAALLNFMSQYVVVFATPFFLQLVLHEGPARVGLVMTAFPLAVLCVAPFAGALSDRIGTAGPALAGSAICSAACLGLAVGAGTDGPSRVVGWLALFGVGTGIFQSPNNSAVMGSAPRRDLGVVSSLLGTTRTIGMVLGIAAAGAVLHASVPSSALLLLDLHGPAELAFLNGIRRAYAAGALFAAAAALLSLVRGRTRRPE
jgi:EmrB/QacA subfamily drug resistance transporter